MKNIIFDLGGVIVTGTPESILDSMNIDVNDIAKLKIFFKDWDDLDLGYISLEEKLNMCNFDKFFLDKYRNILLNYYKYRKLNSDLIDLILQLKKSNKKVYILSDNNNAAFNYFKGLEQLKCVDGWVISYQYNSLKRDGLLFKILLDSYGLDCCECYFIDDNEENIRVASLYGIDGFLFDECNVRDLYDNMRKKFII